MDKSAQVTLARTMVPRKVFSLSAAQRALPLVRRVIQDVVTEYAAMIETQELLEGVQRHGCVSRIQSLQQRLTQCSQRLREYARELDDVGVELRDYARGAVDFPCSYRGRRLVLTWQLGQEAIENWYDPIGQACMPLTALRQMH